MAFEHYVRSGQKQLRCGYTTGTCAALAAQGAAALLLTGTAPEALCLTTPKGWEVRVAPAFCRMEGERAVCAVRKDAGDDPDATDGLLIVATVCRAREPGVRIDGGPGVGRVTRPGLDQPVGAAAINTVPRRMIAEQAEAVRRRSGYAGGLEVLLSIPEGEAVARRTFNPHLGIEGGLSILGTSGIVEPMSEQALVDTIELELRQARAASARLFLAPGNYGLDYLAQRGWAGWGIPIVKCSNFLGEALDIALSLGFQQAVLVGHAGKLVKLAGGVFQTHSRYADCRSELFCAHAALCGADAQTCRALMDAATVDACLACLDEAGLRPAVLASLLRAIQLRLDRRTGGALSAGAILFSNVYGELGRTETAREVLQEWETAFSMA